MLNTTELQIGPLKFQHQVQKISIQERKAISSLETTRSGRNFIVDSGESEHKAQIRLLFTGLNEINGGVNEKGTSGLRGLIALFRCSPIISCYNEYLSHSWKQLDQLYDKENERKIKNYLSVVSNLNSEYEAMEQEAAELLVNGPLIVSHMRSKIINDLGASPTIQKAVDASKNLNALGFGNVIEPLSFFRTNRVYSDWIPITLDNITLENVPDLPQSIQATLTISRIDVNATSESGELEYSGELGPDDKKIDPKEAYWLIKWIEDLLATNKIARLAESDFKECSFDWYGETAVGSPIKNNINKFTIDLTTTDASRTMLISESCTVSHKFAYNKLLGRTVALPQHMGCTGRFLSLDIVFNNQKSYSAYEWFCKFKESSDLIIKSKERSDRVTGWYIGSPIAKLLNTERDHLNSRQEQPGDGIYVPLSVYTDTGTEPHMINCRIDLVENNIDFFSDNEILLVAGGTDYKGLRNFYDKTLEKELSFRRRIVNKEFKNIALELSGEGTDLSEYDSYRLFWPIDNRLFDFDLEKQYGVINTDVLRAAFLHPDFDTNGALRKALYATPLAVGELNQGSHLRITLSDKFSYNYPILSTLINGIDFKDKRINDIFIAIKNLVESKFIIDVPTLNPVPTSPGVIVVNANPFTELIAKYITIGLLGDRVKGAIITVSSAGSVMHLLAKSGYELHPDFKDAIFNVIVEREKLPENLPYVYSVDGVYAAFHKLITAYSLKLDSTLDEKQQQEELLNLTNNKGRTSMYPDLLLPSYEELYGPDRWQEFAPTVEDLGIDDFESSTGEDRTLLSAVQGSDIVSPASWFYIKRVKSGTIGLRNFSKQATAEINRIGESHSLSIPFNTSDIDTLTELVKADDNKSKETLEEIISNALEKLRKTNKPAYRETLLQIASYGDKLADKYFTNTDKLKLYIHHNGNWNIPRDVTIPGIGAEIYKVASKKKLLETVNRLPRMDADERLTTPLQKEIGYHRHLNDTTEKTIQSSLKQIPDDQYSTERLFPAIKVYLLDRRGDDIIADDTLFSVASIISVDVTLDKDDADLAVIKIADPLYTLQSDYFDTTNVITQENNSKIPKRVQNTLRKIDNDSFLKRYKLAQGRSIQIRMGYSSMAYNLPVIFTGRISEIVPGDTLTIVAQGWKAELINRQVNFYNDDPRNWGARDLAIQAIVQSSPEGFGDYYPEYDSQFILRNLESPDVQNMITQALSNSDNVSVEGVGDRSVGNNIINWMSVSLGLNSVEKRRKGFDTRLKNIWYPDTALYNNLFGLRTSFGLMPSWSNDSWIVPLQPAWDVLKEAARHAWNCIVQVVPYDGQATIFMGHPDQMYFYTKGTSLARARWKKYQAKTTKNIDKTIGDLFDLFKESKYYKRQGSEQNLLTPDIVKSFHEESFLIRITSLLDLIEFMKLAPEEISKKITVAAYIFTFGARLVSPLFNTSYMEDHINKSGLPGAKLQELKQHGLFEYTSLYLFSKFFGLDYNYVLNNWNTVSSDLDQILSRNSSIENIPASILNKIEALFYSKNKIQNIADIKAKIDSVVQYILNRGEVGEMKEGNYLYISPLRHKLIEIIENINRMKSITTNSEIINNLSILEVGITAFLEQTKGTYAISFVGKRNGSNSLENTAGIVEAKWQPAINQFIEITKISNRLYEQINTSTNYFNNSFLKEINIDLKDNNIKHSLPLFKAFVYYFALFCLSDPEAQKITTTIEQHRDAKIAPNMKVFRVHHFADDSHNIIQNNIVATTREMWNTVVIEHPAPGSAETVVGTPEELYTKGRMNAGANWVYYPKQEVTGVIGLQFHPGLTLSNKKINVFTELNCQTPALAAKLACTRLAEGIQKMYRGNLLLVGKHIKPYDRIILADSYTRMAGPIEVDSVVHHWNCEQGWITNIIPSAVCEANAGASILQTAIMETTFQAVYNTLEFVSDALTIATIVATAGAATPLAVTEFSTVNGLKGLVKNFFTKGLGGMLSATAKGHWSNIKEFGGNAALGGIKGMLKKGNRFNALKSLYHNFGGPAWSLIMNETYIGMAQYSNHLMMTMNVIPSFVESASNVEQLPVILSPLIYNGNPFTAGLETEDSIWAISAFGIYYSAKKLQQDISRFYNDYGGY